MAMFLNGRAKVGDPNAVRSGEQIIAEQRDEALARARKAEAEVAALRDEIDSNYSDKEIADKLRQAKAEVECLRTCRRCPYFGQLCENCDTGKALAALTK